MATQTAEQKVLADYKSQVADLSRQLTLANLGQKIRAANEWQPEGKSASDADVFGTLQKVNASLMDVLQAQQSNQPVYVSSPAPASSGGTSNYLIYVGLALVVAFFLFRR